MFDKTKKLLHSGQECKIWRMLGLTGETGVIVKDNLEEQIVYDRMVAGEYHREQKEQLGDLQLGAQTSVIPKKLQQKVVWRILLRT